MDVDESFLKIVHLRQNLEKVSSMSPLMFIMERCVCVLDAGPKPCLHGAAERKTEKAAAPDAAGGN